MHVYLLKVDVEMVKKYKFVYFKRDSELTVVPGTIQKLLSYPPLVVSNCVI